MDMVYEYAYSKCDTVNRSPGEDRHSCFSIRTLDPGQSNSIPLKCLQAPQLYRNLH